MLSYFIDGRPSDPGEFPSDFDKRLAEYINTVFPYAKRNFEKSVTNELFGKDSCHNYKLTADLQILGMFLSLIYAEKNDLNYFKDCPAAYNEMLYKKYKLDCLKSYFKCYNIDVVKLLRIFGLDPNQVEDGINFMQIEGDGECYPPFQIV